MFARKMLTAMLTAVLLACIAAPLAASAASIAFTATVKTSLDKTISLADSGQANQLSGLYDEQLALLQRNDELNGQIKWLHKANADQAAAIPKRIKGIDAEKLGSLEADVVKTKEKYKPLFASYADLNKQIEQARKLKIKELTEMLRFQASLMQIAVQSARAEIKVKEQAWQAAKAAKAKTVNKILAKLDDADPVKEQIKAKQSAIKITEGGLAPLWNTFKQSAKQGNAPTTIETLSSLVVLSGRINDEKLEIRALETKVSDILAAAKTLIP